MTFAVTFDDLPIASVLDRSTAGTRTVTRGTLFSELTEGAPGSGAREAFILAIRQIVSAARGPKEGSYAS